jgi:hypothetical protein
MRLTIADSQGWVNPLTPGTREQHMSSPVSSPAAGYRATLRLLPI